MGYYNINQSSVNNNVSAVPYLVDYSKFLKKLQKKIRSKWHPPQHDLNYKILLGFNVNTDGTVGDINILKSTNNYQCNFAAIKAVRDAAPFDSLPEDAKGPIPIEFDFDYKVY